MKLHIILLLMSSLATAVAETVAVIGAGATGITNAILLKERGYDVVMFEASESVGGVAVTKFVRGRAYDMATMFVSGFNVGGLGPEPTLNRFMGIAQEPVEPALDVNYFRLNSKSNTGGVPVDILDQYSAEEIKEQLLRGFAYSVVYAGKRAQGLCTDCMDCEIFGSNLCATTDEESITTWGNRPEVNLAIYAQLVASLIDGLCANPAFNFPVRSLLLFDFTTVDTVYALKSLGLSELEWNLFIDSMGLPPTYKPFYNAQRWWQFQKGYQTFFESLVENAGLNVSVSTKVTSLNFANNEWVVATVDEDGEASTQIFDKVLVTTTPIQSQEFLPEGTQKELLFQANPRAFPSDSFIVRFKRNRKLRKKTLSIWPEGTGSGTVNLALGGTKFPLWIKRHERRNVIFVASVNPDPTITVEEVYELAREYASTELGIEFKRLVHHRRYFYPQRSGGNDLKEWNAQWAVLQGQNGLYFSGESFSGAGVAAITGYASRFINDFTFPDICPVDTDCSIPYSPLEFPGANANLVDAVPTEIGVSFTVFGVATTLLCLVVAFAAFLIGKQRGKRNMLKELEHDIQFSRSSTMSTISTVNPISDV